MGGGKIKDATATPQDVMIGKVFYNNDGKQVGSLDNVFSVKTLTLRQETLPSGTFSAYRFVSYTLGTLGISYCEAKVVDFNVNYNYTINNINGIIGVKINGTYFDVPSANCPVVYTYRPSSHECKLFAYDKNTKAITVFLNDSIVSECIIYYL